MRSVPDPGVITTRQSITPAGIQAIFESRIYGVTFGATSAEVYVLAAPLNGLVIFKMDWRTNKVLEQVRSRGTPGKQGIAFDRVTGTPLVSAAGSEKIGGKSTTSVRLISVANGAEKPICHALGTTNAGGVAVPAPSRDNSSPRYTIIPLTFDDAAAIVDLSTGTLKSSVKTGIAPFGAAINAASTVAYVSNWGGRFPRPQDLTAATGSTEGADLAVVDKRGIAASGTVSRIDIATGKVTNNIEVGLHPTSLAWDEAHHRLFVSNSNSDTISVIDTARNKVVETISVQPFERKVAGVAPEAVVVSHDGRRLYAACAGINAVAVIGVGEGPQRGVQDSGADSYQLVSRPHRPQPGRGLSGGVDAPRRGLRMENGAHSRFWQGYGIGTGGGTDTALCSLRSRNRAGDSGSRFEPASRLHHRRGREQSPALARYRWERHFQHRNTFRCPADSRPRACRRAFAHSAHRSTSSRRTGPTTSISAESGKAMATRRSRRTATMWCPTLAN